MWTADGGKTWHVVTEGIRNGNDDIVRVGQRGAGVDFTADPEQTKINANFQGHPGITIDLSAYKDATEPVKVLLVAVPKFNPDKICILYQFNVTMN